MPSPSRILSAARHRIRSRVKAGAHNLLRGGPPRAVLVVLGCQRSGTTAFMRTMDLDWNARVYGEFSSLNSDPGTGNDSNRFGIRLRPLGEVAAIVAREPYPLVVCKPLVESQRASEIMASIGTARCLWMFRHYRDVAESFARTWTDDVHVRNLEPIADGERGNWRSEFVPDDVRDLVRRHYAPDMNPWDGGALFWYARNRLLFDLHLANEPRVMLVRYERFAAEPDQTLESIYRFVGVPYPGPRMARGIHPQAIGRGKGAELAPEVQDRCQELWERLTAADEGAAAGQSAA